MNFFDLVNISEKYMEILDPISPEKLLFLGRILGADENSRVIDFGCGYGELLVLWAEKYGISGLGIEVREHACERAGSKVKEHGLSERIEIVCSDGKAYAFKEHEYDIALAIGTTFIWDGFKQTIHSMKQAIQPGGKLAIGEVYWLKRDVPPEYARIQPIYTEYELLQMAREEGFDIEYIIRANHDDWDRYNSDDWYGLLRWIEENPDHPEKQQVIDHLHKSQDNYLKYEREYLGWAMYVLNPVAY